MLGWMMHKLESRLRGEISITSHTQLTASLWQMMESKEESKSLLRKFMKEGCEKAGLKLNIQKTEEERTHANSFYATLISKPEKRCYRKGKLHINMLYEY